jgi:phosphate transport system permease protein
LEGVSAYLFGRQWLTASFWQDWYGVVPLFVGSLMVSAVALFLAMPLGVGAAMYVNQIASAREQRFIKPCIEFISAFPSVVLGFLASRCSARRCGRCPSFHLAAVAAGIFRLRSGSMR